MNKMITAFVFVALSSVSAKAAELPDFGIFSLTGGIAANQSVFGATAKQDKYARTGGTIAATNKESGAFTESFGSQFVELGVGPYISFGYEHVPDSISTPENINSGGSVNGKTNAGDTSKVSVDFNDFNTVYAKLNTPWGIYLKAGTVETDIDIKETQLSGNTYKNKSVSGTSMGGGYEKFLGESGFSFRLEANYIELDNVTVDNGQTRTNGTGVKNFKEIKATNLEGLTGKMALAYTFGKN